jgi:hypothetical protein
MGGVLARVITRAALRTIVEAGVFWARRMTRLAAKKRAAASHADWRENIRRS